jgi:ABC-type lipoprotein export system ATPase subunit
MLTASDVGYRFAGGRRLFAGVSLSLERGDAVAIEGPSGTGKTTLLALLGGLLEPSEGEVRVEGAHRAPFGWVLQTLNSLSARSVLANAELNNVIDGVDRSTARDRARRALDAIGLGDRLETRARQLSGGELQRLAVARVLASTRPIVLADEPTNQLDRANAELVMAALFATAVADRRVVVVVTHDHDALPDACRVLRLTEHGLVDAE